MLEDQVSYLLQRYLGNYVRGLNKEALKISVWQGDVELRNMQLKPEALNALKLPVKVKAGFLGSVKIKVPWSRLGQDPVLVYLDRIFLLAEPETQVEGCTEDSVQETKRSRVRQMESKLLEKAQILNTDVNKSWLGSLINTVIGNLKLSISNIHIRYEDVESNPGHPFAAGLTLEKLSAFTVDDEGNETFITGGSLDRIQKSIELDQLAFYLDSDISPWHVDKSWEDLLPQEWVQVFKFGTRNGKPADHLMNQHTYILQPVTGNAKYIKLRPKEASSTNEPLQKAAVNLDDVTLCLSKEGYRNMLKLVDNFAAFNQRLRYAHYRPLQSIKSDPGAWWKYAFKVVSDQMKKASGKLSWDQVLRYTTLRKRYISLYASLLKSDPSRDVVDGNTEIESLDRGLDMEVIIQWRMLAHKLVDQSVGSLKQQKEKKSWWSLGWGSQPDEDESKPYFSEEDMEQLNKMIGYNEGDGEQTDQYMMINRKKDAVQTLLVIHMTHNASKLIDENCKCLAELSCERLDCSIRLYPETKAFDMRLGSYRLSSPSGLLAESAVSYNSLVGAFCYKPFDANVDWSMKAKASPCYMTYLKDSVDAIVNFFESNTAVSHTTALETAAAVQMTIDGVRRSAQQQVNRALKDHARFLLDLDIAAPKITVPTDFQPNRCDATKLLLDLGHLVIRSQDDYNRASSSEQDMYWQFDLVLSDVSAFLIDGDYQWNQTTLDKVKYLSNNGFLPVIDKCGVILTLQQIRLPNPSYPSTRLAIRVPSLGFHFSPARYHRLLQVAKIFQGNDIEKSEKLCLWDQADFEGWLSLLNWKGVGNREAVWKRRYFCLVGPFLYVLEGPGCKSYKQYLSLRGKQLFQVPEKYVGNVENVLAVCSAGQLNSKVVEDVNALILRCDSDESRKTWQSRLQGAIYRASGSAPISGLSETSSESEDSETECHENQDVFDLSRAESVFITGILDELKICFASSPLKNKSFTEVLLAEEGRLFEFRAIGGQVELSMRENDMFIGMVLKSLEIEDLVCSRKGSRPRYLARSLIRSINVPKLDDNDASQSFNYTDSTPSEGEDNFYEAPENLVEPVDYSVLSPDMLSLGRPDFSRIANLLPGGNLQAGSEVTELSDALDSFVKAQIVIYDQNSILYRDIDKQVRVSLATLSLFCRRPMILAIIDFVNAINIEDERCESFSDDSPVHVPGDATPFNDGRSMTTEESVVKGLLGKGKSRIVFQITINMARAQILLINEDETKLATLSQDNLLTDIKMFPSSFSIKASLGNLKISDDSLQSDHMYFWMCDMRNPGGSSFVELVFTSFNMDDEDYEGYEYSLFGQLSEVRIVYLNRFIQEVVNYFLGLVPDTSKGIVKLKDQVTNSEKWFTTSEIEGSPAVKLDLSLMKPIILMPRMTNSPEYLKLDVVHITIRNNFQWLKGNKSDINAIRLEILTIEVKDINLNVGIETELGESIIQNVKGISVVIRRSLRDVFHVIPSTEVSIKINELQAALSNKEYQVITECALSNISETPHTIPDLNHDRVTSLVDTAEPVSAENIAGVEHEMLSVESWILTEVSVVINLVELRLHMGATRDAALATVQIGGAWLLYKSNTRGEGFLSSTLKSFTVIDDREGTEQEFRLAIGIPHNFSDSYFTHNSSEGHQEKANEYIEDNNDSPVPTMLILDAKFSPLSTSVSLAIQRPQLLVALDFLLAVVEFFVPAVGSALSNEDNNDSLLDAILLDQAIYFQPCAEMSLSPQRPLIADDEKANHFVYDGKGGILYLKDRQGSILSAPSSEGIIYVGTGKKLQFRNVVIKNGHYLDSCIVLGANSSYSVSLADQVYLEKMNGSLHPSSSRSTAHRLPSHVTTVERTSELVIELQAIGPELTFYNTAKDVGKSTVLSNKLLHAQLDAFCRLVQKGDTTEMSANVLGLTMESNGVRIIEPFDTYVKYSNASRRTNMHITVSDIFMNFSFSILRLFLAVEDDILTFLRMTSKQMTVKCSEFEKVGTLRNPQNDQIYAFWRPRAPPGFAVLGDYVTPLDKPPSKGILAVNINFTKVKRPLSFKLVWPPMTSTDSPDIIGLDSSASGIYDNGGSSCSIWFPEAPAGYVAMGCVVSRGRTQPPLSSVYCIMSSLVSPGFLRDCITISSSQVCAVPVALWRVANSFGTFLPADTFTYGPLGRAYELRHMLFVSKEVKSDAFSDSHTSDNAHCTQSGRPSMVNSGRHFEAIASFQLVWWNQGSSSRKKISIWRPVVPQGMVYFGDIAVKGFEPPSSCIVLNETRDNDLLKSPLEFRHVGQIRKQRGIDSISFWLPQAPPGFVSLGCIACKGSPKHDDFHALRCIRTDMVTGDHFSEESIWDTNDARISLDPFSIWAIENELGNFIVRSGLKKPPKRFALKLADPDAPSGSDVTVIDAEIRTFSAALFDDYGGLMVPLFNISLSGIGFSLHGRPDHINSTVSFSLATRSYNDKYELWEPLIEPVDGVVRYQYDLNAPGATSQLRITCTKDLNLNISVSNANMIIQAYTSWNNFGHIPEYNRKKDPLSPTYNEKSTTGIHHKKNYYIIPQNKLGQDIFIRATEVRGLQNVMKMPSGDMKPIKVPVLKDMLDSHLKGSLYKIPRAMVMIIIAGAQLRRVEEFSCHQYTLAIRLLAGQGVPEQLLLHQQSARTSGIISHHLSSELDTVTWNEIFFFKVDSPDYYTVEFMVTEVGKGNPIGYFSAPLSQIGGDLDELSDPIDFPSKMTWIDLHMPEPLRVSQGGNYHHSSGKVRCAVLLSTPPETNDSKHVLIDGSKSGFIQISPSKEGPWTTVRLNYAAPAACWRLGNDVVASEVNVKDGNRYVNIRSLVSVRNNTDLILDFCLMAKTSRDNLGASIDAANNEHSQSDSDLVETDEFFETELYSPATGWISCSGRLEQDGISKGRQQEYCADSIPSGWEWIDNWLLDTASVNTSDGWVYAPDVESLKWPESFDSLRFVNYARQRRWVRHRRKLSGNTSPEICLGPSKPGDIITLPLSALSQSREYVLQLRPSNMNKCGQYTWSSVVDSSSQPDCFNKPNGPSEIIVSDLVESHKLLYCNQSGATSSDSSCKILFCVKIQATEIARDIRSDPIQDWGIEVKAPLSITNFLPLAAEYSVLEMQTSGHFVTCSRGVLLTGENEKLYSADIQNPLFLSLIPQRGWLPKHDVVLISHPHGVPSKTFSLRSSISGRTVQVVVEQNSVHEQEFAEKLIRVYAPYWFSVARCPPLTCRIVEMKGKNLAKVRLPFRSRKKDELNFEEITEEEFYESHTIASALNFNTMGLTVAISYSNEEQFGPVKDLSSLGDMDGSLDLYAYDADNNCARLFVSTKPCPYQSVPTKVISIRPFMTFTNRLGQDMFIKLSSEDDPKVLHATDTRISFVYRETSGTDKLQVRLADTEWSFPIKILKEDTISLVLRKNNGSRVFITTEIRGYEEGSRFVIVFRLGSTTGPIRFENRTSSRKISIRHSGFGDDAWIQLGPLATTIFSWEDPYGQKYVDAKVDGVSSPIVWKLNFEESGFCSSEELGMQFQLLDAADVKVARFIENNMSESQSFSLAGNSGGSQVQSKTQKNSPFELVVELGVVGISVIDHRPKELFYFFLERVFISYSTGYDGGATSRFKLIVGHLQLDNQLPLTLMPVLMAPEQATDITHPVFKMTITIRNEDIDGIQVYPYVYIRVTDRCWRLNIHEPIIWASMDFYNNLRVDHIPSSSSVTQVDPEIRFDLIDVSEVRLKLSLETAPAQRPRGVLGVWSPILSAVGNAFKIQVHLRRVMHRDRFMRKSSILPAIGNRIWRDLIHNPLHLIFSVDVLGMTRSTLASLSKGFAELSTDGQFLQLRAKQIWSRRITGVGDGFIQGTEALAQGVAFGVTGVVTKPVESARQNGLLGLAEGLGRAFVGFIVQPVSGALDFFSLTVGGIGASCSKCLEVFSDRASIQRIRIPRAIRADGFLREYCEREALGQMILYLAESSRHFGCTEIFKEPSKFAWTDAYEEHFIVPHQRIVVVTNRRVILLQCVAPDKMDKKPCKIMWDVPWEELMAVELAKAGCLLPSHIILHLKSFKRSETFVRVIKCNVDREINGREPQASKICSVVRKMWKTYQLESKSIMLKVPSSQRNVYFAWSETDERELSAPKRTILKSRDLSSLSSASDESRFVKHSINYSKIWSSEQESKSRCTLCRKQKSSEVSVCSIWRPTCPDGYTSIGDIAHVGGHPPNVSAVYRLIDGLFTRPIGYDLVWRNCADEYISPVSIWHPRAPDGFVSPGCVAVAGFKEPEPDQVHCVAESLTEGTEFENQRIWSAPDSYPWACHIYQIQSDALHFVALRQTKEESDWKAMRVRDLPQQVMQSPQ